VRVRLWGTTSGDFSLCVEDDGIGMDAAAAQHGTGLGQKVIRAMASGLGSEVTVDPEHRGTRVVVSFQPGQTESAVSASI
jgi:nitrate/nitrite-specific signal transduction histidine kinase